jgi:uncharacterized protein (TIGR04255 family)
VQLVAGLPDFDNPPVIETVLGVQFTPLPKFNVPHYGLYWEKIKKAYNRFEVHPPIVSAIEDPGSDAPLKKGQVFIDLATGPNFRCWFIDESRNNLIQVQRDRFILNWRKARGDETYPHYENIRPKFEQEWLRFCEILVAEGIGTPEVNQCEVTYVNHIEFDNDLTGCDELKRFVASWSGTSSGEFLPKVDKVSLNTTYAMREKKGRLRISMQPVIRSQDAMEILQLDVSATGRPTSSKTHDILEWLDLGREWVVKGFADFTTPEMHKKWRRKNDR